MYVHDVYDGDTKTSE